MSIITSPQKTPLFINRNFALLWVGQSISSIGDFFFTTTITLWVATQLARGQSWTPLAVSWVVLASVIPLLLVGPIAGVFVDRWDKRRTMLYMDAVRAGIVTLLLLVIMFASLLHSFHTSLLGSMFGPIDTIFSVSGIIVMSAGLYVFLALRSDDMTLSEREVHEKENIAEKQNV